LPKRDFVEQMLKQLINDVKNVDNDAAGEDFPHLSEIMAASLMVWRNDPSQFKNELLLHSNPAYIEFVTKYHETIEQYCWMAYLRGFSDAKTRYSVKH
jgi:hypothetical protein